MPEDFEHQPPSPSTPPPQGTPIAPPPPVGGPYGTPPVYGAPAGYPPSGYQGYQGYQGYPGYRSPYASVPVPSGPKRSAWFYIGVIGGSFAVLCLLIWGMVWATMRTMSGRFAVAGNQIAVIDISGVILSPEAINAQLRKFGDDSSVKAILLHINSPGGGAAASQEVYQEVVRIRKEKHKKIVASVESVGASGAYYIASGCDKIYANDASVVGSIGVIMEWTNYGDLLRWAKLKNVTITAGELKDAGDPSRELTPKEQAYFQSLVDNMYTQFIHDVAVGRHISEDKLKPLATGQVWTGQQSLPLGLIDKVGGFRTALMDTAREVGISGEPTIVRPPKNKRGLLAVLADDGEDLFPNPSQLLNRSPGFYYMWK